MRIGKDEACFIIGIFMTKDWQKHIERNPNEESHCKSQGENPGEGFASASPTEGERKE